MGAGAHGVMRMDGAEGWVEGMRRGWLSYVIKTLCQFGSRGKWGRKANLFDGWPSSLFVRRVRSPGKGKLGFSLVPLACRGQYEGQRYRSRTETGTLRALGLQFLPFFIYIFCNP